MLLQKCRDLSYIIDGCRCGRIPNIRSCFLTKNILGMVARSAILGYSKWEIGVSSGLRFYSVRFFL